MTDEQGFHKSAYKIAIILQVPRPNVSIYTKGGLQQPVSWMLGRSITAGTSQNELSNGAEEETFPLHQSSVAFFG